MSPILIRPVREQLEHDRVIRLLLGKWRKKYEAAANPGDERNVPLKVKGAAFFPDLILAIPEAGKKSQAVVEVETSESLNHLEALAQWTNFSKAKGYFYLYVPTAGVDVAKRLAEQHHVNISELWSYYQIGDQVRFLQVFKGKGTPELSMVDEEEPPRALRPEPELAEPVPALLGTPPAVGSRTTKAAGPGSGAKGVAGKSTTAAQPTRVAARVPAKAALEKASARRAADSVSAAPSKSKKVAAKPIAPIVSQAAKAAKAPKKAKPGAPTVRSTKSSARTSRPAASAKKAKAAEPRASARAPKRSSKPARAQGVKGAAGQHAKSALKKGAAKSKGSRSRR